MRVQDTAVASQFERDFARVFATGAPIELPWGAMPQIGDVELAQSEDELALDDLALDEHPGDEVLTTALPR